MPPRKAAVADARLVRLGQVIRRLRLERGMNQAGLAEAAGVSERYVGTLERGVGAPTFLMMLDIAKALGMSPEDLMREARMRPTR